jgi:thymidylate synthase ThyX
VTGIESFDVRKQAEKNRQSSTEILNLSETDVKKITDHLTNGIELYQYLISAGAARESARKVLPLCTQTTLYMTGNIRSWIHYLELRCKEDTQLEHREIALSIKNSFNLLFPAIAEALFEDDKKIEIKESPRKNTLLSQNMHPAHPPNPDNLLQQEPTPEEIMKMQMEYYEKNNILVIK